MNSGEIGGKMGTLTLSNVPREEELLPPSVQVQEGLVLREVVRCVTVKCFFGAPFG